MSYKSINSFVNPPTAIGSKVALPITAGTLSFYTPLTAVFIYYSERQAAGRQLTGNYPWLRCSTKVETPLGAVFTNVYRPLCATQSNRFVYMHRTSGNGATGTHCLGVALGHNFALVSLQQLML